MFAALVVSIFLFSFITALFNGRMGDICTLLLASPQKAVELTVSVGCSICLWNGIMEVAQQSGLLKAVSRFFSPVITFLFPGIKKGSAAAQAVCMNLAANLLGLGAAAAPAGIRAVKEFQKGCSQPDTASDNSILVILLNTASLQLIPTTAATLRLQAGSSAPMEILPCVWLASSLSIFIGVAAYKIFRSLSHHSAPEHHPQLLTNRR